jgi:hypothetical protein
MCSEDLLETKLLESKYMLQTATKRHRQVCKLQYEIPSFFPKISVFQVNIIFFGAARCQLIQKAIPPFPDLWWPEMVVNQQV